MEILPSSSTVLISYVAVTPISDYAKQLISKVEKFRNLKNDFDTYEADKISPASAEAAIRLIKESDRNNLPLYFVAPGRNGDILVEFKNKEGKSAEIYVNPDGTRELLMYQNENCIYEGDFVSKKIENFFIV